MNGTALNQGLLDFIRASPTPFHATATLRQLLENAGYTALDEADHWQLQAGGRYLVTRNDSSLIAFCLGDSDIAASGLRMIGAHTDSPCLHVKPEPDLVKNGYYQLGVETYGGALLYPWFDRDLSIAGRISYRDRHRQLGNILIDFSEPVAIIPSLAIHLEREAARTPKFNPQQHLPPLLMQVGDEPAVGFRQLLQELARQQHPELDIEAVLEFELSLYDCQPGTLVGLQQDFLVSARLDNLLSCFIAARALIDSTGTTHRLLVCSDHEEVGSASSCGADGPFLKSVLERLCPQPQELARCINRSWLISVDNAHGIHPNYADKHDANHGPLLNQGPVIKTNANQHYASNSETAGLFRLLCEQVRVPVQAFSVRSDMSCGSTIGPITASTIGVRTLDVGIPTFAMHSIRETAGARDSDYLRQALVAFLAYNN
ncbi:Aspartyl aminopeptidase [hydrothermal vent metagenome]|uniref:Aspartyl aminopeptidase n=1 Tax=hydrothermal vent metagenome TaxID=652676 RepID=A0A3B0YTH2_9ZZZZ